jgi:hypothetical protein
VVGCRLSRGPAAALHVPKPILPEPQRAAMSEPERTN